MSALKENNKEAFALIDAQLFTPAVMHIDKRNMLRKRYEHGPILITGIYNCRYTLQLTFH